jgi:phosphatidylglycerophosphate synthase
MRHEEKPSARHRREHNSVLAAAEKRALIWIARRLPRRINSDHLSALGLAAMAAVGGCFAVVSWTPLAALGVIPGLFINWFGDSLDGTVARVRNQQRPRYGFYVDHVIDIAGATFLFVGLAASSLMHPALALGLLAAYLLVSAELYLATHTAGVFRMSFLGFGPTELRIVLALGAAKVAFDPHITIGPLADVRLFDAGGVIAIGGLIAVFVVSALRNTAALYREEPLPAGSSAASDRHDGHASRFEAAPHAGRETYGAGRVSVQTDGIDGQRSLRTVSRHDASVGRHANRAFDHCLAVVNHGARFRSSG